MQSSQATVWQLPAGEGLAKGTSRRTSLWAWCFAAIQANPKTALLLGAGAIAHAMGHAFLALLGGTFLKSLVLAGGGSKSLQHVSDAIFFAFVGAAAAASKAMGGALAAWSQARLGAWVGSSLRLGLLEMLLDQASSYQATDCVPRQGDHAHVAQPVAPTVARSLHDVASPLRGERVQEAPDVAALTIRVREVEQGIEFGVLGGVRAGLQLLPLGALLFWMAPTLAASALAIMLVFSAALGTTRRAWKRAYAAAIAQSSALLDASDEAVRHAPLWRVFGAAARAKASVAELGAALGQSRARMKAAAAALSGANELLGALALVLVATVVARGWLPRVDGPVMVSFAVVFFLAYKPIREWSDARLSWRRAQQAFSSLGVTSPGVRPAAPVRRWEPAVLDVEDLVLAHGHAAAVSFRAAPGEWVCVVGPTGAGKTTLVRTLLGLEPLRSGRVRYDDRRIETAGVGPGERPFAWAPQEAPLLAASAEANVELGPHAHDGRRVLDALDGQHLSGLQADGVRTLSGGERQRVAIARALASDMPVLLLDEVTSGLDEKTEERMLDTLRQLQGRRTIIMVTHRPAPLRMADRIVRLGER